MKLVDDWKKAWRWFSVELAALSAISMQLYEQVPQFKEYISDSVFHYIMTGCVVLIIVGRVVQQEEKSNVQPPAQ